MASNSIATDSAAALREVIGADATASFENDPRFIDSNPTANASSEHLGEDDDAGDDGRAGAVDEDALNDEEALDLDDDEPTLSTNEAADMRDKLSTSTGTENA